MYLGRHYYHPQCSKLPQEAPHQILRPNLKVPYLQNPIMIPFQPSPAPSTHLEQRPQHLPPSNSRLNHQNPQIPSPRCLPPLNNRLLHSTRSDLNLLLHHHHPRSSASSHLLNHNSQRTAHPRMTNGTSALLCRTKVPGTCCRVSNCHFRGFFLVFPLKRHLLRFNASPRPQLPSHPSSPLSCYFWTCKRCSTA